MVITTGASARERHRSAVHDVDRTGRALDPRGERQPGVPQLVQQGARRPQMTHRDRRPPRLGGGRWMTGGDPHELDVAPAVEGTHQLECRDGSSPGNGVPALFECHSDPHPRIILSRRRR